MEAIAAPKVKTQIAAIPNGAKVPKKITWEEFQRKYLSREDSFKYEWVNGEVIKTQRTMDYSQIFVYENLVKLFNQLEKEGKVKGRLISEVDTFFLGNHRRPDIAWFTDEQIALAKNGVKPVPQFIIEVISKKDQTKNLLEEKMDDYRTVGVKVVWQVFPYFEKVHVYTGENLDSMTVCQGERFCSAAPALPDFVMAAKEVFK